MAAAPPAPAKGAAPETPAPAPVAPEAAVTKGQLSSLSTIAPSSTQERFLVVDTAAFIRGVKLERFGSTLCTVPEVLGEIKDHSTRQRIAAFPVPVQQKEPTPDDIRVITAFAKKTGDLAFLSVTDLKVLALTYMLHRQLEGVASLRTEPLPIAPAPPKHSHEPVPPRGGRGGARGHRGGHGGHSHNNASGAAHDGSANNAQRGGRGRGGRGGARGGAAHNNASRGGKNPTPNPTPTPTPTPAPLSTVPIFTSTAVPPVTSPSVPSSAPVEPAVASPSSASTSSPTPAPAASVATTSPAPVVATPPAAPPPAVPSSAPAPTSAAPAPAAAPAASSEAKGEEKSAKSEQAVTVEEENDDDDDSDSDEDGWITPDNIAEVSAGTAGPFATQAPPARVACMTADFAMQNTLLQLGLAAFSVEGLAIRRAHQWALQCHGCFTVVRDTAKLFCPNCGHNTLLKVSLRVDSKGHVTTRQLRRQVSTKGTRFAMPMPKGGRTETKIVTAEDQLPKRSNKATDASDPDHLFFATRAPDTHSAKFLIGGKEGPRKNPNQARRKKR